MAEKNFRQMLTKAEEEFIDKTVNDFRQAIVQAYMKGLNDGANMEREALASGTEPLHVNLDAKDDDGPVVRLKPEARLKRMVKPVDFLGCRNMRRILNILTAHDIRTYGDLAALTEADVLKWRNFGKVCFDELCQVMKMWNIEFKQV